MRLAGTPLSQPSDPLPTYYIPHGGGPCFFMEWPYPTPNPWTGLERWLRELPSTLPRAPRAVLVVSGHWEEAPLAVNVQAHPPLFFDYYGFPEHTYHLTYPAPGAPQLAAEIQERLVAAGVPCRSESRRGMTPPHWPGWFSAGWVLSRRHCG